MTPDCRRHAQATCTSDRCDDSGWRGDSLRASIRCCWQTGRLIASTAHLLLQGHFPASLHDDIRTAVGLRWEWVVRDAPVARDPNFRSAVLRAYERRCAVCNYDIRLGDELLGLEAAHIKWHAAGGPDDVSNGLALCGFHHKALDRGAWGLEPVDQRVSDCRLQRGTRPERCAGVAPGLSRRGAEASFVGFRRTLAPARGVA